MTSLWIALVAVLALISSLPCEGKLRIRKELRSMSATEYGALLQGLSTMFTVGTEAGQSIYGPRYRTFDTMLAQHAVSVNDPRGDQGHFGPCFMTFHRAWLLELEESLLAVAPEMKGLPYIDITLDLKKGLYYNTSKWIYSPKYGGNYNCETDAEKKNGCEIDNGPFARKLISYFDMEEFSHIAHIYNGSLATGLMRGPFNPNPNKYITRQPYKNIANLKDQFFWNTTFYGNYINVSDFWANAETGMAAGVEGWNYTREDYLTCNNAAEYKDWVEWHWCADFSNFVYITSPSDPKMKRFYENFMPPTLHSAVHWFTGGESDKQEFGEMFDLSTSPNDPLLFLGHHANLDRSAMNWQVAAQNLNASIASSKSMWGYPAAGSKEYPFYVPGCYLDDVVNANFPFTNIFDKPPSSSVGYTHYEVLDNTRPGMLYKYQAPPY